ncbi:uncharacterized protein RJT21DRAFT_105890 [Scheffersomyces amazonensis]|uniref:uncharacterized protein n=1 Tax=Scheffersomyces amazonensis TaxID=1078765 RepID=UPI00315DFC0D
MPPTKKNGSSATRRKHTNSKLGCLNCKRKKIRCNEQLPICGNCLKGKKEVCSYLSLNQAETDRIRLTHSLRNSQNKLLNQDYRLPTSSSNPNISDDIDKEQVVNKNQKKGDKISLEFKFELSRLPLRFPSISYPPVQFSNMTINDFSNEFKVIHDSSSDESDANKNIKSGKALPNALNLKTSFHKFNYSKISKRVERKINGNESNDMNYHIILGKINIMDYFNDFLIEMSTNEPYIEIVHDTFICLGHTAILNQFHQLLKYNSKFKQTYNSTFVDDFEKKCFEKHGAILTKLRYDIVKFQSWHDNSQNDDRLEYYTSFLGYASFFLTFSIIPLNFSAESYFNSSKGIFAVFEVYNSKIKDVDKASPLYLFLLYNMHFNLTSINVPSYNPEFMIEVQRNLNSLSFIYKNDSLKFKDDDLNFWFDRLKYQYNNLINIFDEKLMPILFKSRDENFVTTYPASIIYDILKKWFSIFPSEAMAYNPNNNSNNYHDEQVFLNDLTTTLYVYYQAISASLSAIFSSCKYLYGMNYMSPCSTVFYHERKIMETNKFNPYHQQYFNFPIDGILQRHNYYAMRLLSFFNRRNTFYQDHLEWSSTPYNDYLRNNRLKSRSINSYEVPIKSFTTTLIRPEHYPTKLDVSSTMANFVFTRRDETMIQKLYARNIETLNFFDQHSILQFDYETMLLLRDYRPIHEARINGQKVDMDNIREYYEDKSIILNSII